MIQNFPTHSSEFLRGEVWPLGHALLRVGKVDWTLNLFRNPFGFLDRPREEQNVVSTRLQAKIGSAHTFRKAVRLHRRRAGADNKIGIATRLNRIAELLNHLLDRNRFRPAIHIVVEPLRANLIVNAKAGGSSVLEHANGVEDVGGLAESAARVN